MDELRNKFQDILREILDDDSIIARDEMSAADFPEWDSLAHLNIVISVEKAFGIRFAAAEIAGLKKPGQTVGTFLALVAQKRGQA